MHLIPWIATAVVYVPMSGVLARYLWMARTPIDASVHRLRPAKIDDYIWDLGAGTGGLE